MLAELRPALIITRREVRDQFRELFCRLWC
jgi:hypothetical protein